MCWPAKYTLFLSCSKFVSDLLHILQRLSRVAELVAYIVKQNASMTQYFPCDFTSSYLDFHLQSLDFSWVSCLFFTDEDARTNMNSLRLFTIL